MLTPPLPARAPGRIILPEVTQVNMHATNADGTGAWSSANRGIYMPFIAPHTCAVTAMQFFCGSGTNNHDLGLYDAAGNKLISRGQTATTGGALNTWTLGTPQPIEQGVLYWGAMSMVSTLPSVTRVAPNLIGGLSYGGIATQVSVATLPATANFGLMIGAITIPILCLLISWP